MKKALVLAAARVLLLAGLAGWAPGATGSEDPGASTTPVRPPPQTVWLMGAANGRKISLHVGDMPEVALPGNPSTGYGWQPQTDPWPTLVPVGQPRFRAHGTGLGAVGLVTLSHHVQPGEVDLTLRYVRPAAPPDPNAQEFDVTVSVQ